MTKPTKNSTPSTASAPTNSGVADIKTALLPKQKSSITTRKIFSWIGSFIEAELDSFSWPSLIAWIIDRADKKTKNLSPEQNALATAVIWQIMAIVELGLQYYLNVTRADGTKDPQISDVEGPHEAPVASAAIILSIITQAVGGITAMLAIDLAAADAELFGYLTLGLIVGSIQSLAFLMSDAQTLWLSFMASKKDHEKVKHITQQSIFEPIFKNARRIAEIGCNIYPPLMAGLGTYFVYCLAQTTASELNLTEDQKTAMMKGTYCILPLVYEGSVVVHSKFDIANMLKGLEAINILIEKKPYLTRSRYLLIRLLGYLLHGQALTDPIIAICNLICKSKDTGPKIANNTALFFHALTTYAQTYRALLAYVASFDQANGGLLLNLYVDDPKHRQSIANILVHVQKFLAAKVTYTHWSTRDITTFRETRSQAGLQPTPAATPGIPAAAGASHAISRTPQTKRAVRSASSAMPVPTGRSGTNTNGAVVVIGAPVPARGLAGSVKRELGATPLMSLNTPPRNE